MLSVSIEFLKIFYVHCLTRNPFSRQNAKLDHRPPVPPPSKKKKSICGPDFETFPNIQDPLTLKSKWAEIAPTPVYLKVQKLASEVTGLRARKPQRRYI